MEKEPVQISEDGPVTVGEYKTVNGKPAIVLSSDFAGWLVENDPELRAALIKGFRKVFDNELEKANGREDHQGS